MFQYRNGHNNSSYFKHHLCLHRKILFFLIKCSTFCFLSLLKCIRNTDHIFRALFTTPEIRCCRLMWQIKMFHYFDGHTPIFNSRLSGIYLVIWFARHSQYYILCIPEKKNFWNFSFYNVLRQFWGLSLTIFHYH